MNWYDRLNTIELEIRTGDGFVHTPLWIDAQKNIEFNTEGFEFIGIDGTFVERNEAKGTQFPVTFFFVGENHLDDAKSFLESAKDKRPWSIKHPYYDKIKVQPLSLTFDNIEHNTTRITGTLWETIEIKYPRGVVSVKSSTGKKNDRLNDLLADRRAALERAKKASTGDAALSTVNSTSKKFNNLTSVQATITELKNRVRVASSSAQNFIADVEGYIRAATNLINWPFLVEQNIEQKLDSFINTFNDFTNIFLKTDDEINPDVGDDLKFLYQIQGTSLLSALANNIASSSANDFRTRQSIVNVIDKLTDLYDEYILNLDTAGIEPDPEILKLLDDIIQPVLANLYDLIFDAKQERRFLLDADDNIVRLAHRFYGPGDDNLEEFIKQNQITLREFMGVEKGREIIYFV